MTEMGNVFAPNPDCPVREIREGFVVLAANGEIAHAMDDVEAFIWRRLDGRRDLASIHADLVAEYDVDADVAAKDLLEFADQLVAAGLVVGA